MSWPIVVGDTTFTEADFQGTNHITNFPLAFEKLLEAVRNASIDSSTTGMTISTGIKTCTLSPARPYFDGMTALIVDGGNPSFNYMYGVLETSGPTAGYDPATGNARFNVFLAKGAVGPFSDWDIKWQAILEQSAVPVPVSKANGAFGVDMASNPATGLAGFSIPRLWVVQDIVNAEPGSPTSGQRWIQGDSGTGGAGWLAVGAGKVAEWNGSSWVAHTPAEGQDLCYVRTGTKRGQVLQFSELAGSPDDVSVDWCHLAWPNRPYKRKIQLVSGSVTLGAQHLGAINVLTTNGATITLPDPSSSPKFDGGIFWLAKRATDGSSTITIEAGGEFQTGSEPEATSFTLSAGQTVGVIGNDQVAGPSYFFDGTPNGAVL